MDQRVEQLERLPQQLNAQLHLLNNLNQRQENLNQGQKALCEQLNSLAKTVMSVCESVKTLAHKMGEMYGLIQNFNAATGLQVIHPSFQVLPN